ncbi:MAG TPA: ABC transporter permease [Polyangiaceae bacterium]|nr:ABC transporter permease [Polyangiaceae bacterium]
MSTTWTIAKREFRSYFDSPLAYVVICLSFIGLGLTFFTLNGGFWQLDRATLQPLFHYAPRGLGMLVVPVVTMRLMAEERRSGTLEMLITLPVKDSDVILGKFLGAFGLVLVVLLGSIAYPLFMFNFPWNLGPLDMGPVVSGYVGLFLYSAAAVSVGLLVSSLADSQAVAFFITFAVLAAFGFVSSSLAEQTTGALAGVLNYVSFEARMGGFARGLIDTRDVVFFVSITVLSLMVSFRALERRKWA